MQSNKKSKTEKKKVAKIKAVSKKSVKDLSEESASYIRKTLSKFLTNLCEKKYAEAHKDLEDAVEAKVKGKIKKSAKNAHDKNVASGKSDLAKKAIYAKQGSYVEKKSEKGSE